MSGLAPRPGPTAAEVAAVAAALTLLAGPPGAPVADPTPRWRFSGRWFQVGRYDLRRPVRRA